MKKQKFAIYTKNRFGLEKVCHIYDELCDAAHVCDVLNSINPCGSPVYRVKPVIAYEER